jgi:hypothetical protein
MTKLVKEMEKATQVPYDHNNSSGGGTKQCTKKICWLHPIDNVNEIEKNSLRTMVLKFQ